MTLLPLLVTRETLRVCLIQIERKDFYRIRPMKHNDGCKRVPTNDLANVSQMSVTADSVKNADRDYSSICCNSRHEWFS
jgi:hypothetical protein